MDRSAIFVGSTGTRADRAGETVDAIEKKFAASPRMARPSRNWMWPSPISRLANVGARHLFEARLRAAAIPA